MATMASVLGFLSCLVEECRNPRFAVSNGCAWKLELRLKHAVCKVKIIRRGLRSVMGVENL